MSEGKAKYLSEKVFLRLQESPLFDEYQQAFRTATGLPIRLVSADPNVWQLTQHRQNQSPFCELLNLCENACHACIKVNKDLMKQTSVDGPSSCHCFAGLSASAIPVKAGTMVVGYLKTGQVFRRTPTAEGFEAALDEIGKDNLTKQQLEGLRKAYFETASVLPERYQSMVTLLEHFGRELSALAEKLAIAASESEPESISKARQFIHAKLDEQIHLPEVARIAGMSESHFCRQFKQATKMTLTEYVNYSRVLLAKQKLLKPGARISEVAFDVGFQSLSQFNRSFAKFHGGSPSQYRDEALSSAV